MHVKRSSVAAAIMAGSVNAAVIQGAAAAVDANNAVVYEHYIPAKYISTVFETSVVSVMSCPPTETACPLTTGVLTSIIPVSTTVCPATITSVVTSGTPTGSAPLQTVTITGTETITVNPSTAVPTTAPALPTTAVPASKSGPSSIVSAPSSAITNSPVPPASPAPSAPSAPASSGSASTPTGVTAGGVTGSESATTSTLQSTSTMHVTSTEFVTVPAPTTAAISSVLSFVPTILTTPTTSPYTDAVAPMGTGTGTIGGMTPSSNGTFSTAAPSPSAEPFLGIASQQVPARIAAALVFGAALFFV